MHLRNQWAAPMLAALVILLSTGSFILAGPVSRPDGSPVVIRAAVDPLEADRLVIRGTNFGVTTAPVVTLANTPLQLLSFNDEEIVAKLPLDAPAARYWLQVLVDGGASSPLFEVTLGQPAGRGRRGERLSEAI